MNMNVSFTDNSCRERQGQALFISYAREDDETFAKTLYTDLLKHGFDVWWDREKMQCRGRTFLQEIRDAIEASDRVLLVVGPKAIQSENVRFEWEHALLYSKGVVPLLRIGDYNGIPDELNMFHCPDFRSNRQYNQALKELIRILRKPVGLLGPLRTPVPNLPPHFLPRRTYLDRVAEFVLSDVLQPTPLTASMITTAFHGMGGIGKSVLAAAFARTTQARRVFCEGIIWITVGQVVGEVGIGRNMLRILRTLGLAFGDSASHYIDLESAQVHLLQLLENKRCLIVLDDVWHVRDVTLVTNLLGPRCRLLITTRDGGVVSALDAQECLLDVLSEDDALKLLTGWCSVDAGLLPSEAKIVGHECGHLPFALSICGALIRDGVSWSDILDALKETDLSFIEKQLPNYPYSDILKSLQVGVNMLAQTDPNWVSRYYELVVFPPGEPFPEEAVATLWSYSGNMKRREARKLLSTFNGKALLTLEGDAPNRQVIFHDLQRDYLCCVVNEHVVMHNLILEAYLRQCPHGWASGPNDGYYFQCLIYHLIHSGKFDELEQVLTNLQFLETKANIGLTHSLSEDFNTTLDCLPMDREHNQVLSLLEKAIRRDIHFIARHPSALFQCLWNSCWWYDCQDKEQFYETSLCHDTVISLQKESSSGICELLEKWRAEKNEVSSNFTWIRSLRPPPNYIESELSAVYRGHEDKVVSLDFSPNGSEISSASADGSVRIWDIITGAEIYRFLMHTSPPKCVAFSSDGVHVASGDGESWRYGGNLYVWNSNSGAVVNHIQGGAPVEMVTYTSDGCNVITMGYMEPPKKWEAQLVDLVSNQKVESITSDEFELLVGVAFTSKNSIYFCPSQVAVGYDKLKISKRDSNGISILSLLPKPNVEVNHWSSYSYTGITVSSKYRILAVGLNDNSIRVLDMVSGNERFCLCGHKNIVKVLATTSDGKLVSGSDDGTVKIWNLESGQQEKSLCGHVGAVSAIACSSDSSMIASASEDNAIRLWKPNYDYQGALLREHLGPINSLSCSLQAGRIVTGSDDGTIRLWSSEDGRELFCLEAGGEPVVYVKFSSDGRKVISMSRAKSRGSRTSYYIWDAQSGAKFFLMNVHEAIQAEFSLDARRAVTCENGSLYIWDTETGDLVKKMEGVGAYISTVALSPDGRNVVACHYFNGEYGYDNPVAILWDIEEGCKVFSLCSYSHGQHGVPNVLAFSPDGSQIVFGGIYGDIKIWDVHTGLIVRSLSGHRGAVTGITYSLDGRRIVSESVRAKGGRWGGDNSIRISEIDTGRCLRVIEGEGDINGIAAESVGGVTRVLSHGSESIIAEANEKHEILAWFPERFERIGTLDIGNSWAGARGNNLYLIKLERFH